MFDKVILSIVFSIVIITTVIGNLLMCGAIFHEKKLRKPENLFLVSLAASDILIAVFVMTFAAANDLMEKWAFGAYCFIWLSMDVMCCTASILNLCAIGFDRYWHIKHPLRYGIKVSARHILLMIMLVWIVAALISFVPFSFGLHSPTRDYLLFTYLINVTECRMDLDPIYAVASSTISFFIPCVVMIVTYSKLYLTARQTVLSLQCPKEDESSETSGVKRSTKTRHGSIAVPRLSFGKQSGDKTKLELRQTNSCNSAENMDLQLMAKYVRNMRFNSDNKARRTIGIIMGVFIICWFPFFLINIFRSFWRSCIPDWLFQIVTWLGYANSSANPLIYGICSRDFRIAFKKIICFWQKKKTRNFQRNNYNSVSTQDHSKSQNSNNSRRESMVASKSSLDSSSPRKSLRSQILSIFLRRPTTAGHEYRGPSAVVVTYVNSPRSYGSCRSNSAVVRTISNSSTSRTSMGLRQSMSSEPGYMTPPESNKKSSNQKSSTSKNELCLVIPSNTLQTLPVPIPQRQRAGSAESAQIQKQLGIYYSRERSNSHCSIDRTLFAFQ